MNKNLSLAIHYLVLLVLVYLVVFLKLGSFHIRWGDESMFVVNSYEMLHNGKWFSLYFNHAPDIYNTKPPMTNWLQIIFIKIAGFNEGSLRMPSAIANKISEHKIINKPEFWISIGLLYYFGGTFSLFITISIIKNIIPDITSNLWSINDFLAITGNILFFIGLRKN